MECVVLAGGLGTRLRSVVADVPKPMAPLRGRPFLEHLLSWARAQGVKRFILAVGHQSESITQYFGNSFAGAEIVYSLEKELLGTGGGIRQALTLAEEPDVLILNGDSFFDVPLEKFCAQHRESAAVASLALKPLRNFDRYGTIELQGNEIHAFVEKKFQESGLISGGVYVFNRNRFLAQSFPERFSIEQDFFAQAREREQRLCGFVFEGTFIDIGIPEDYRRAESLEALYRASELRKV